MTIKELREKTMQELHALLAAQREAMQALRFKAASQELKDVREIRETRKTIARILMVMSGNKQK